MTEIVNKISYNNVSMINVFSPFIAIHMNHYYQMKLKVIYK